MTKTFLMAGMILTSLPIFINHMAIHTQPADAPIPAMEVFREMEVERQEQVKTWFIQKGKGGYLEEDLREALEEDKAFREKFYNYIVALNRTAYLNAGNNEGLEGWGAAILIHFTPPDLVLEAIVPELGDGGKLEGLFDTGDSSLQHQLELVNRNKEIPSFHYYQQYLKHHPQVMPQALIAYMMNRSPQAAMRVLINTRTANLPDAEDVVWAAHVVDYATWTMKNTAAGASPEAVAQLEKLSRHEAWWARLYVAEILRQHPEFRDEQIVQRLSEDENELVREMIAEAQ